MQKFQIVNMIAALLSVTAVAALLPYRRPGRRKRTQGHPGGESFSETSMNDDGRPPQQDGQLKAMIDHILEVIIVCDMNGVIRSASASIEKYFGWEPGDIIGTSVFEMLPASDALLLGKKFKDRLAEVRSTARMDCRIRCKDGSYKWIELTAANLIETRGIDGMFIHCRDITERKLIENALHLQNTAVQSAANAIVITDREGTIISVNQAFTQSAGYAQEEVVGKKTSLLKSGNQPPQFYEQLWKTILGGNVWKGEIENRHKDGRLYTEEMTITPVRLTLGGEITHFIAIKQDITERKKLEQEFFQIQKVQSIGRLAGGIAHDFNNILGIILGYVTMLEKRRLDREKFRDSVSVITQAVDRGTALVQQILTFARKTNVQFEPLNIAALVHEMVIMLEQTFPKTIIFKECFDPFLPEVNGDRTQLHQAMLNLCVNARDAMPEGGTITISADLQTRRQLHERFPSASDDRYLCLSVRDSGEGMDEATRRQVFDPFFTTKGEGKGTGLGLSVVYGVVQSHAGYIDVESRRGDGTQFSLYLPVHTGRRAPEGECEPEGIEIRGGTETILVVEDEEPIRAMICAALELYGYRFWAAMDGREALDIYTEHHDSIAAVISDMGLPSMNGLALFNSIKQIDPTVKVMLTSGFFEPAMKDELLTKGADCFISKPYRPEDLLRGLREVLDAGKM